MKNLLLLAAAALLVVPTAGCYSGPSYLSNSVKEYRERQYAEKPLMTGFVTDVIPIFPLVEFFAFIPDFLILNPIQFWGFDVPSGEGASFDHDGVTSPKQPFFVGD